jgi:dUTP pyrophosphatase
MSLSQEKIRGFLKVSYPIFFKGLEKLKDAIVADPQGVYDTILIPKRATAKSAGYDFCSPISFSLAPGSEIIIPTGIKAYMQDHEVLMLYPRSSLGFKYNLKLKNTVGIIDADYYNNPSNEGHILVALKNEGKDTLTIEKGHSFCQGIFIQYLLVDQDDFSGKKRIGGSGSTD